jgi:hypothetical protein
MHDRSHFSYEHVLAANFVRSPRALALFFAAFLLAAIASGCSPSLGSAIGAYEHGRYPEAMEELRAVEWEARPCRPRDGANACDSGERAVRFALYRGLTHLALGDLAAARFWLARVDRAVALNPATLSAEDASRLASAQAHMPP